MMSFRWFHSAYYTRIREQTPITHRISNRLTCSILLRKLYFPTSEIFPVLHFPLHSLVSFLFILLLMIKRPVVMLAHIPFSTRLALSKPPIPRARVPVELVYRFDLTTFKTTLHQNLKREVNRRNRPPPGDPPRRPAPIPSRPACRRAAAPCRRSS